MILRFANPDWLWLLVPALALVWGLGWRLRSLGTGRRVTVLVLRSVLFALVICCIAGLEIARKSNELAVMFAIDDSDSIPADMRKYARKFVEKAMEEMTRNDRAGVLLFGADSSIELNPQSKTQLTEFLSAPSRSQTDIAGAVRLAMAALPSGAKKRVVLLTDGNETKGEAEEAARAAAGSNVALDVVPLSYEFREDTILEKVVVENQVSVDEPFDIKIYVDSRRNTPARLNIFRDGVLIGAEEVQLEAGKKNVFVLPNKVDDTGFHRYSAQVEVAGDANPENNQAESFTMAQGEPKALWVEGGDLQESLLPAMLRAENIDTVVITPDKFPQNPAELQNYNTIIFSNVPADAITQSQMKLIERAVHDMGIGFIMVGGPNSFGAGGWQDTPVEEALPVSMDIKQKKILPQGALVIVMHTIEIPEGELWGREIGIAALNVLSARDEFGVLAYDFGRGESWIVPLQQAADKIGIRRIISTAQNGDMPTFDPTLQQAYDGLMQSKASVKHIIVISDGDPQSPNQALATKIRSAGITISAVQIGGHSAQDVANMKALAQWGGGSFYAVTNNRLLPQIFVKEASVVRKSLIFEDPFHPKQHSDSELLAGISSGEYPTMYGYVAASPKELATLPLVTENEDDPLLAHWRYGLGKTAAFTSDATQRWARDWFQWGKMSKFWSQVVRWTLRQQSSRNMQMTTEITEGKGRAIIDAVDDDAKFLNFLDFESRVITPDFDSEALEWRQTAPGHYEAEFDASDMGTYLVTANAAGADKFEDFVTGGASVSYSPEFQTSRSNDALIRRLADVGKGRVLDENMPIFDHKLPSAIQPRAIWPFLLGAALVLLLVDIFFRRVLIDWAMAREGMAVAGRWLASAVPRRGSNAREERMETLLDVKRKTTDSRAKGDEAPRPISRTDLLDRLDKGAAEDITSKAAEMKQGAAPKSAGTEKKTADPKEGEAGYTSKLLEAKKRAKR